MGCGPSKGREPSQRPKEEEDGHWALLSGDVTRPCPSSDKIVRIFLSSTFTDTKVERNELMKEKFPALRNLCQSMGYQFQVVDMRWGVTDEATDDHSTVDLCLREIERCKQISTGPCFVALVSHKYGYRGIPREIDGAEFKQFMGAITSEEQKELLNTWYRKDENAEKPVYILQPISSQFPEFLSKDKEARKRARSEFDKCSRIMLQALTEAAQIVRSTERERARALKQSVTEAEIRSGLLVSPSDASLMKRGLCFYREIEGLDSVTPDATSKRYKDCDGSEEQVKESKKMLEDLKTRLKDELAARRRMYEYKIKWNSESGINPDIEEEHRTYIRQLCEDFYKRLKEDIKSAVAHRENSLQDRNPLLQEVTQHIRFCGEKLRCFYGRQDALKCVHDYLKGSSESVFVIHGQSGCGKTSIVAMAAKEAWKIQGGKGAVILRFLGTTPDSTTVSSLLSSIIRQLQAVKDREMTLTEKDIPTDMASRTTMFYELLETTARASFPVTVLLDSLDQLDPSGGARQLTWLRKDLPPYVKMIVSTLPEDHYEAFPKLKARYENETSNFYDVPRLGHADVSGILEMWLKDAGRRLTPDQMATLLETCKNCPLPLFLKLSFDEACRWRSYWPPEETKLEAGVRESINVMFTRMEGLHGKTFVERALGYLTVSRGGLTETELEDVLSCDDEVLNSVYVYHTPPVRRLPPLLLVRLKDDLMEYMVDRGADGVQVFFWYHRQFLETARARYCDDKTSQLLHAGLADFFAGTWATVGDQRREKPYTVKGTEERADRIVTPQPLMFGNSFNLRKLNNLPHHAIKAKNTTMLHKECLLNYDFLRAKLEASAIRAVLDDYTKARKAFPKDEDVETVGEALQLSQVSLHHDPKRLPSQILGRIPRPAKSLEPFLEQCRKGKDVYLLPNQQVLTPVGGQLVHSMAEHTRPVDALAMTADGKFVITCSYFDGCLYVINVEEGKRVQKIEDVRTHDVNICCDDTVIVTIPDDYIVAYTFSTAKFSTSTRKWRVEVSSEPKLCFCGHDRSVMVVFHEDNITLYDANTGDKTAAVPFDKPPEFLGFACPAGSMRYAAVLAMTRPLAKREKNKMVSPHDEMQGVIVAIDLQEKKIVASIRTGDLKVKDESLGPDELKVKSLVLSSDGSRLVCATYDSDELYFLDVTTLETKQKHKASHSDLLEHFHVTPDGRYIYSSDGRSVWVWDLHTSHSASCPLQLQKDSKLLDVATADLQTIVSLGKGEPFVRIWNLNRGLPAGKTTALNFRDNSVDKLHPGETENNSEANAGEEMEQSDVSDGAKRKLNTSLSVASFTANLKQATARTNIANVTSLQNSRYVLLLSVYNAEHFLQVFDVAAGKVVRRARIGKTKPTEMQHVTGTCVTARVDRRLVLIDVNKMAVVVRFAGHVLKNATDCICPVHEGKEIVTMTADAKHLKVYSVETGEVTNIIRQRSSKLRAMDKLMVNKQSSVAVATAAEGTFPVFDLLERRHLYSIVADAEFNRPAIYGSPLTADGRYFFYTREVTITRKNTKNEWKGEVLFVYDLQTKTIESGLVNTDWFLQRISREAYVFSSTMVDERHLVSLENSGLLIYDIHTGEIKRRVGLADVGPGRIIYTDWDCPVLVTGGSSQTEGSSLSVWRKNDLDLVAAFSSDTELDGFTVLGSHGNEFLAVARDTFSDPVIFSVHDTGKPPMLGNQKLLSSLPEIFGGQDSIPTINLDNNEDADGINDPDDDDDDVTLPDTDAGDGEMAEEPTLANSGYITSSVHTLRWEAGRDVY